MFAHTTISSEEKLSSCIMRLIMDMRFARDSSRLSSTPRTNSGQRKRTEMTRDLGFKY
jgi:hypothetical protein